jgi:hypothetical protein
MVDSVNRHIVIRKMTFVKNHGSEWHAEKFSDLNVSKLKGDYLMFTILAEFFVYIILSVFIYATYEMIYLDILKK